MTSLRLGRLYIQLVPGTPNRLVLVGRIDDSAAPSVTPAGSSGAHVARLSELASQVSPGELVIDTGGVTFINSIGMREWMRLLHALHERGSAVILERVADVLMTQMNMIPESAKTVRVVSFHAQYVCPRCGAETASLVDAVQHAQLLRRMQAPALPCLECGADTELGDFAERYLSIFRG